MLSPHGNHEASGLKPGEHLPVSCIRLNDHDAGFTERLECPSNEMGIVALYINGENGDFLDVESCGNQIQR